MWTESDASFIHELSELLTTESNVVIGQGLHIQKTQTPITGLHVQHLAGIVAARSKTTWSCNQNQKIVTIEVDDVHA